MPKGVTERDKEIGQRIKARRKELDLSQADLAKAIGVTFQQVQKYEKGSNRVAGGRLMQVADALQMRPSALVDNADEAIAREQMLGRRANRLVNTFDSVALQEQNLLIGLAESLARVQGGQALDAADH